MQAYIKDGDLIINDIIQKSESKDFDNFIDKAKTFGVLPKVLYDVEGNICGIKFITKKGE